MILEDALAVEEPLQIRLGEPVHKSLAITMRTPGQERELALGFLWTEGLIQSLDQVERVEACGPDSRGIRNTVRVDFREGFEVDLPRLERNFYTTSSCGVCGKTAIEALRVKSPVNSLGGQRVTPTILYALPHRLRSEQKVFESTGGLHASALFDLEGSFLRACEDVGRHNALDKLIGQSLLEKEVLPMSKRILLLSGRASFELLQKASMVGLPLVAAIGAPSSLAVELAQEKGITLVGFLKKDRFNIYSHPERISYEITH